MKNKLNNYDLPEIETFTHYPKESGLIKLMDRTQDN